MVEALSESSNGDESQKRGNVLATAAAPRGPSREWKERRQGAGLALSGGGYRAALFGLGSLWRLNELGQLRTLRRIVSVSGGSLTAGVLATAWKELRFDGNGRATNFEAIVVPRVRSFCSRTIDRRAFFGSLLPLVSAADITRKFYEKHVVKLASGVPARLSDLPQAGAGPDFVFMATCIQTGASFRFSREGLYDWKLGWHPGTDFDLSVALAASAGFPPVLSPVRLKTDPSAWIERPKKGGAVFAERICSHLILADGGIYDNMGTEALWKNMETVLISDAGAPFKFQVRPWANYGSQLGRVRDLLIEQTRALRKRKLIAEFDARKYRGAYWGINTKILDYEEISPICIDSLITRRLGLVSTRLRALPPRTQEQLINWGYALADAAVRNQLDNSLAPGYFPYRSSALRD